MMVMMTAPARVTTVPLICLNSVMHAGRLDPARVGENSGGSSLEGHSLSVSLCPQAWRRVARLGGTLLFELSRAGGVFLDMHAVQGNARLLAAVLDWAVGQGLTEWQSRWQTWVQDEDGDWGYTLSASLQEAVGEAVDAHNLWDHLGEDEDTVDLSVLPVMEDGRSVVQEVRVPVGGAALRDLTGLNVGPNVDATDAVLIAWAMQVLPDLLGQDVDGVWWRETYRPAALSAPRGAIFPARVPAWAARREVWSNVDDAALLRAMPRTRRVKVTPGAPRVEVRQSGAEWKVTLVSVKPAVHLGWFGTEVDAQRARQLALKRYAAGDGRASASSGPRPARKARA